MEKQIDQAMQQLDSFQKIMNNITFDFAPMQEQPESFN